MAAALLAFVSVVHGDDRALLVTAGFLSKFPLFLDWPQDVGEVSGGFCVRGTPGLVPVLAQVLGHVDLANTPLVSRVSENPGTLLGCRLVYLGPEAVGGLPEVIREVPEGVLVVTQAPGAAQRGAHINLYRSRGRLRFEVNVAALERSGLRASFRLLELARVVD